MVNREKVRERKEEGLDVSIRVINGLKEARMNGVREGEGNLDGK